MIGYTPVDRLIGREVGRAMFLVLSDSFDDLKIDPEDPKWEAIVGFDEPDELKRVRAENPTVPYPMVYLASYYQMGRASSPFIFPPRFGQALRLDQYLDCVCSFVTLQFSGSFQGHVPLISYAINSIVRGSSWTEALSFVDGLWRGRAAVSSFEWGALRRLLLSEGSEAGRAQLEKDHSRLTEEALRLIQVERALKREARSLDEWLHEVYCLLPDLCTWFAPIHRLSCESKSDELGKFDRIIDEFLADIGTSISIPSIAVDGGETFSDAYLLGPLRKNNGDIAATIAEVRGLCRGRTIIPHMWYEYSKAILERISFDSVSTRLQAAGPYDVSPLRDLLTDGDRLHLDGADPACAFGRSVGDHWDPRDPSSMVLSFALNC